LHFTTFLEHVKSVFPIELLRLLLALIAIGSGFMAGQTEAAVRQGRVKTRRHYVWMARALVCLAALAFRHPFDTTMSAALALSAIAVSRGWWRGMHQKPPEDLSHDIVPRDP
jgi:hypothetical protein